MRAATTRWLLSLPWPPCVRSSSTLSHINAATNLPTMVDVSAKAATVRVAVAQALVVVPEHVLQHLVAGSSSSTGNVSTGSKSSPKPPSNELYSAKGPVFATAIVAGVMGAKNTAAMIPFCHPLPLDFCDVRIELDPQRARTIRVECTTKTTHKTGVEMEALVGATQAALCVYDMLKAASHDIEITEVKLLSKRGGKSDYGAPSVT